MTSSSRFYDFGDLSALLVVRGTGGQELIGKAAVRAAHLPIATKCITLLMFSSAAMGSGQSKKGASPQNDVDLIAANGGGKERRRSHVDTNPPPKSEVLVPCGTCDRRFAADRIERHAEVCAKAQKTAQRRSVFDVQGQRLEGTEAEEFRDEFSEMEVTRSGTEWRKQHERMVRTVKKDKRNSRPQSALDNIEFRR